MRPEAASFTRCDGASAGASEGARGLIFSRPIEINIREEGFTG